GELDRGAQLALLAFQPADPSGYGRLILNQAGAVMAVREHRDASEAERRLTLCNAGAFAVRVSDLVGLISRITNRNSKGEYYLTDAVAIAVSDGALARPLICAREEALGVNTLEQLAEAEAVFQWRARKKAMQQGVTLIAPHTLWLSFDSQLGRDVRIEP